MTYTDDGITLDYDKLKELFADSKPVLCSRKTGSFKHNDGEHTYFERTNREIRRLNLEKGHINKQMKMGTINNVVESNYEKIPNSELIDGMRSKDRDSSVEEIPPIAMKTKSIRKRKTRGVRRPLRAQHKRPMNGNGSRYHRENKIYNETMKIERASSDSMNGKDGVNTKESKNFPKKSHRSIEDEKSQEKRFTVEKRVSMGIFSFKGPFPPIFKLKNKIPIFFEPPKTNNIYIINQSYRCDPTNPHLNQRPPFGSSFCNQSPWDISFPLLFSSICNQQIFLKLTENLVFSNMHKGFWTSPDALQDYQCLVRRK